MSSFEDFKKWYFDYKEVHKIQKGWTPSSRYREVYQDTWDASEKATLERVRQAIEEAFKYDSEHKDVLLELLGLDK